MEVGDSFLIPDVGTTKHYKYVYGNIHFFESRYKENFNGVVRFEADEDGVVGLRVWRGEDRERKNNTQ
jgi:hypothetical protein